MTRTELNRWVMRMRDYTFNEPSCAEGIWTRDQKSIRDSEIGDIFADIGEVVRFCHEQDGHMLIEQNEQGIRPRFTVTCWDDVGNSYIAKDDNEGVARLTALHNAREGIQHG